MSVNDSYIEYGFTCIINNGEERPQCVICNKVLSNDSLKPRKLKQHLHNVHQHHKDKSRGFFERHATVLKKMRLDSNGTYHETNKNAIEASYQWRRHGGDWGGTVPPHCSIRSFL